MGLGRFVVVEGPDVGRAYELPMRGGGIGRGDDNCVQLSDLAVSRHHCSIEWSDGGFVLIDAGSRNSTSVNGQPVSRHPLANGDEVFIGKTRLTFVPAEGGLALVRQGMPSRVTMEVGSGQLVRAEGAAATRDLRAARHLASLAELGQRLRELTDRDNLGSATCRAAVDGLEADRALFVLRDSSGNLIPRASHPRARELGHIELPEEAIGRVLGQGATLALDGLEGGRVALLAPITAPGGSPLGILYAERNPSSRVAWDEVDLLGLGCLANLASAQLASVRSREELARENHALVEQAGGGEFIGQSAEARGVLAFVAKVGPSDATVLLTGESGSGKEMVARAVHRASGRSQQAFIAVNCAAMTESLIESELFGHERGAFTGATERKIGRFEAADKGTLFLDEVGELPLALQTKFLRVLEEQCFERVGGTRSLRVDVRVVAATNRDLSQMVAAGRFREDLFYRLSVIHTVVPPLRARPADIPVLAEHFLVRLKRQVARRIEGIAPAAMAALTTHPWPGNVRELRNAIERAIVLGDGQLIEVTDLPPPLSGSGPAATPVTGAPIAPGAPSSSPGPGTAPARSLRELEREGIIAALSATGGNKAQAASVLQIDRSTLYKKIKDYGIDA